MQARWSKQYPELDPLLSDRLREALVANRIEASELYLFPASNPCWYRYEVLRTERPATDRIAARVRVYEHQFGGDIAGGLPRSWEQGIELVQSVDGWSIDHLGKPENTREEPDEPHGERVSACSQARPTQLVPTPRTTPTPALTAETDAERIEITRRLFEEYLEGFGSTADLKLRLLDYRVDEVRLHPQSNWPRPRVIVVYSVLPFLTAWDGWVAGNGTPDGLWVVRKQAYVEVVKEGEGYNIASVSTGG